MAVTQYQTEQGNLLRLQQEDEYPPSTSPSPHFQLHVPMVSVMPTLEYIHPAIQQTVSTH